MQLIRLPRKQINIKAVNLLLSQQANTPPFYQPDYLDVVQPGWSAIVGEHNNGEYCFFWPLAFDFSYRLMRYYQSFFCRQLGPVLTPNITQQQTHDLLGQALQLIKNRFKRFYVQLPQGYDEWLKQNYRNRTEERRNYILSLADGRQPEDSFLKGLNTNRKRNLKKAINTLKTTVLPNPDLVLDVFMANQNARGWKAKHNNTVIDLFAHKNKSYTPIAIGAFDIQKRLVAGAIFILSGGYAQYLLGARNKQIEAPGAATLLFYRLVKDHNIHIIDFDGGNQEGIGRFFESFGAHLCPYPTLLV